MQNVVSSLRKHAYSNILKILPPKTENSDIFHISAQNIDCGYLLEQPHRVPTIYVLSRNKKNKRTMMVLYRSPDQTDLYIYC